LRNLRIAIHPRCRTGRDETIHLLIASSTRAPHESPFSTLYTYRATNNHKPSRTPFTRSTSGTGVSSRFVDDASMQSKKEEEDSRIADVHCVACSLFYRS
jgi:hypothetical protein